MNKKLVLLTVLLLSRFGFGAAFTLPTLETSMTDKIFTAMAASSTFKTVEGPSDLGKVWGFYVAAGVSGTDASTVSGLINNMSTSYIPMGDLQLGIGLPKGITIELATLPSFSYSGSTVTKYAGSLKLTLNETLLKKFPLTVALRGFYGSTAVSYSQAVTGGTVSVDYGSAGYGAQLSVGKYVGLIGFGLEPFVTVGLVAHSSSIGATGTGNLFGTSFPAGTQNVSGSGMGLWYSAGLMLKLGIFGIAAEYNNLFGISSYAGKLSLRI